MISVLILTRNEEQNLLACMASVAWSDDIHVYDSFSTDATVEIAHAGRAHVTQRKFDDWATHQNWALRNIPFKHSWVFYLDADERATDELKIAMLGAVKTPGPAVAFRVRRRDYWGKQWLKRTQASPYYQRLFLPEKMHYERLVNPISMADGYVGEVEGYLDHFPFSKGIGKWIERHNQYSEFEALQILENRKNGAAFSLRSAFVEADFHKRRYHQKELFYRLPARPIVKFVILYVLKCGFLDGSAGLAYCILQSIYEYLIILKTREFQDPGLKDAQTR